MVRRAVLSVLRISKFIETKIEICGPHSVCVNKQAFKPVHTALKKGILGKGIKTFRHILHTQTHRHTDAQTHTRCVLWGIGRTYMMLEL